MNRNKLKPKSPNLNPFLYQPDPIGTVFGSCGPTRSTWPKNWPQNWVNSKKRVDSEEVYQESRRRHTPIDVSKFKSNSITEVYPELPNLFFDWSFGTINIRTGKEKSDIGGFQKVGEARCESYMGVLGQNWVVR